MFEASDFDVVDNVPLFLGALLDTLCDLCNTAEVSSAMTDYVDIVEFVFGPRRNIEWTKKSI